VAVSLASPRANSTVISKARAAGIVSAIGSGDVPSGLRRLELGFLSELHVDAGMGQGDVQPLIRAGMPLEETGDRMASDSRPAPGTRLYGMM